MNYKIGQYGWSIGSEKRMAGDELGKGQHLEDQVLPFVCCLFSSFQFSCSVMSDSLRPHGLQHARPPCPSLTPGACSNSYPLSQWCHPTISASVVPFSSCLQSFPASGSFQMNQFFTSGSQYWSFSFSFSPSNEHSQFPSGLTSLISLQSKAFYSLLQHHSSKASIL